MFERTFILRNGPLVIGLSPFQLLIVSLHRLAVLELESVSSTWSTLRIAVTFNHFHRSRKWDRDFVQVLWNLLIMDKFTRGERLVLCLFVVGLGGLVAASLAL